MPAEYNSPGTVAVFCRSMYRPNTDEDIICFGVNDSITLIEYKRGDPVYLLLKKNEQSEGVATFPLAGKYSMTVVERRLSLIEGYYPVHITRAQYESYIELGIAPAVNIDDYLYELVF